VQLVTAGCRHRRHAEAEGIPNRDYIRLDTATGRSRALSGPHQRTLGEDLSIAPHRPFLQQQRHRHRRRRAFSAGARISDIYEKQHTLYHLFTNVTPAF